MECPCCGYEFENGVRCNKCGRTVCSYCATTDWEHVKEHIKSDMSLDDKWTCCTCDGIEPIDKGIREYLEELPTMTIIDLLNQEIEWCKSHYNAEMSKVTPEQQEWFIKGLEQAKYIIQVTEDGK